MARKNEEIVSEAIRFVRQGLENAEGGHDWLHTERVWKSSKYIAGREGNANMLIVELGALLHDIADAKFHHGDEHVGPRKAREFLIASELDNSIAEAVVDIVEHISFKSNLTGQRYMSPELAIVQDADRLDAIGAIGIARAFNYGGHTGRAIFDPLVPVEVEMTKEKYKNSVAPTINHFYEKLLLLKDKMNTPTGKALAIARHSYMEQFLEQFFAEYKGER